MGFFLGVATLRKWLIYNMKCRAYKMCGRGNELFSHGRCAIETRVGLFPISFFQSDCFHAMYYMTIPLYKNHLLSAMVSPLSGSLLKGGTSRTVSVQKACEKNGFRLGFPLKSFSAIRWATWLITHCESELAIPEIPAAAAFCYNWSG